MRTLTPAQRQAVQARGHVLVSASAGTGKTRTLIERCLALLLAEPPEAHLDQLLLVTFTEAAALEMRRRLRESLEAWARDHPQSTRAAEPLALLETARVGTLHSLCLELIREHFHQLAVDPQVTVLAPAEAEILATECLEAVLRRHFSGTTPEAAAVERLYQLEGGGADDAIPALIRRVHAYAQSLPEPEAWLEGQGERCAQPDPAGWRTELREGAAEWHGAWLASLAELAPDNPVAQTCHAALAAVPESSREAGALDRALAACQAADARWPKGRKTVLREPLKEFFVDVAFLRSVLAEPALARDWNLVRPHLQTLVGLVREFTTAYQRAKTEQGCLDFPDLEQTALRLLWDPRQQQPTPIAQEWRERIAFVFVDEYQDINPAQDRLLQALSRPAPRANAFLVGDVKQSIYRFRRAAPHLFQAYADRWSQALDQGTVVHLNTNFRSVPGILDFANAWFQRIMRREVGGIDYGPEMFLEAGWRPEGDTSADASTGGGSGDAPSFPGSGPPALPPVEIHLHLASRARGSEAEASGEEDANGGDLGATEQEAMRVAARLSELRASGVCIADEAGGGSRPLEWRDMVILLRSPANKAEGFAKIFDRWGIPLMTSRAGLYAAAEVRDLLNLLRLLDNPLQDIPALAVLRSPLGNFRLDDLARIRAGHRHGNFWTAFVVFHRRGAPTPAETGSGSAANEGDGDRGATELGSRVDAFLERYRRWREISRRSALSVCLEAILDETRYEEGLLLLPRGRQRRANVERLLALTRQFDQFQRQGLFRFLRFIEAQAAVEFDPEPAKAEAENAVRLMSIHQSKGLEFPVVVVADLGRRFNLEDLRGRVILDDAYGLCPLVRSEELPVPYPSAAYWLAQRRQRRATLGEEIRLLYVAVTRPSHRLILVGTTSPNRPEKWALPPIERVPARRLLGAQSALDWLGFALPTLTGKADWLAQGAGTGPWATWQVHPPGAVPANPSPPAPAATAGAGERSPSQRALPTATAEALTALLDWSYPDAAAVMEPAKASVTALRRRAIDAFAAEAEDEARPLYPPDLSWPTAPPPSEGEAPGLTLGSAERGTAHHRFFQWVRLTGSHGRGELEAEGARLAAEGRLTAAELASLDWAALAGFWSSPLGRGVERSAAQVHRELPFTARFSPGELRAQGVPLAPGLAEPEFLVVQGVIDLAVLDPEGAWILDFKTDAVDAAGVEAKAATYAPQLRLYAQALTRIRQRPVREAWLYFLTPGLAVPVTGVTDVTGP